MPGLPSKKYHVTNNTHALKILDNLEHRHIILSPKKQGLELLCDISLVPSALGN